MTASSTGPVPGVRTGADIVAYLGPEGTFTEQAAEEVAKGRTRLPMPTIVDVVDAVRDGSAAAGVVPIENSIEGSVNVTTDTLAFSPSGVYMRAELALSIRMALLTTDGTSLEQVREVRSQPMALAQCREWLAQNLPRAELVAVTSTAEAARQVALGEPGLAALGGAWAGGRYGLRTVVENVVDRTSSTTRFVVLGRRLPPPTGADKTSLVFWFGDDRPGLLLRILEEFALRGINLVKIESRPTKERLGEYCILVDCDGHPSDARLAEALQGVHRHAADVRVLGAYPRADGMPNRAPVTDTEQAYRDASRWYRGLTETIEPRG